MTKRPYTVTLVEQAMKDAHFSVNPNKNAKVQALEVIKLLQSSGTLPIERAQMKIRLDIPQKEGKKIKDKLIKVINKVESEEYNATSLEIVFLFYFKGLEFLFIYYLRLALLTREALEKSMKFFNRKQKVKELWK